MSEIIEFLRARLDEDEQMARAADDGKTHVVEASFDPLLAHVSRWTPPRVLAEVEGKRRIIEQAEDATALDQSLDGELAVGIRDTKTYPWVGDVILRLLALPYANHPDSPIRLRPDGRYD